jgi:hypothetical protein
MSQCKIIQAEALNNLSEAAMSLTYVSEVPCSRFSQVMDYCDRHFIIFLACK